MLQLAQLTAAMGEIQEQIEKFTTNKKRRGNTTAGSAAVVYPLRLCICGEFFYLFLNLTHSCNELC